MLNKSSKGTRKPEPMVINPEGAGAYKTPADVSLFLNASAYRPRRLKRAFYYSDEETLKSLESLIDEVTDVPYKLGMSVFLSEVMGIRTAPVIVVSREAMKVKGDGNLYTKHLISQASEIIFDRADKIADAFAYAERMSGKNTDLPPFLKRTLKHCMENMADLSLKKMKMKHRQVSLADIIKMLHPRPSKSSTKTLYKAVIENSSEASLKDEVITEVLSDAKKTKEEKDEWIGKNIKNIPINALIRNLSNISPTEENCRIVDEKVRRALVIEQGLPATKVLNPFDLLTAALNCKVVEFASIIDRALGEFINKLDLGLKDLVVSILVDTSGSMMGNGIDVVGDYLSFIIGPTRTSDTKLYSFDMTVHDRSKDLTVLQLNAMSPISLRYAVGGSFKANGGTALADAVREVAHKDKPDLMIVLSDEVSWADSGTSHIFKVGCPVIAINPSPQGKFSAFDPNLPVIRLSSLDAKILYYIPMLANFKHFKNMLIGLVG